MFRAGRMPLERLISWNATAQLWKCIPSLQDRLTAASFVSPTHNRRFSTSINHFSNSTSRSQNEHLTVRDTESIAGQNDSSIENCLEANTDQLMESGSQSFTEDLSFLSLLKNSVNGEHNIWNHTSSIFYLDSSIF